MRLSILAFSVSVIVVLAIVVLDPVSRIWDLTLFGDMEELCWGVLSLYVLENQAASHIPGPSLMSFGFRLRLEGF